SIDREIAETHIPIADALTLIEESFAALDPDMGDFVVRARRERWIDARPAAQGRHHGGFQTSVRRGRHPLVFANYGGNRCDVITLAHELGHAYHYWLLREEPAVFHRLPPALAESESTLAESVDAERWLARYPGNAIEQQHLDYSDW